MNDWYRDMTEMDQDSCGKKLICELRSKEASGINMSVSKTTPNKTLTTWLEA